MTYTLYWRKRTGAFAPAAILAETGQDWTAIEIPPDRDDHRRADYLALNPAGRIPTLILPDGGVMTESAAMVLHLAESFPDAGLLPPLGDPARAQVLRWLVFAQTNIYETDLRQTYPDRYTTDPEGAEGVRAAADREVERLWEIVAGALGDGPFLLGARYSLVDPYLAMMLAWHPEPKALIARHPALGRLLEAVVARPAIAPLWRQFELDRRLV